MSLSSAKPYPNGVAGAQLRALPYDHADTVTLYAAVDFRFATGGVGDVNRKHERIAALRHNVDIFRANAVQHRAIGNAIWAARNGQPIVAYFNERGSISAATQFARKNVHRWRLDRE